MLILSSLFGHTIPCSSHIVISVSNPIPMFSGMFQVSSSQVGNPLGVTQYSQPIPMTIQIGTYSIPLAKRKNIIMGQP